MPQGQVRGRGQVANGKWAITNVRQTPLAGNKWILVPMDHFTGWYDAILIPDATALVVAGTLDQRVFCYLGLSEQLHPTREPNS